MALPGYWSSAAELGRSSQSLSRVPDFWPCASADYGCAGGEVASNSTARCARGHTGERCGGCEQGYYLLGAHCKRCPTAWVPALMTALVVLWPHAVAFVGRGAGSALVAVSALQLLALCGHLQLWWPSGAAGF